MKPIQEKAWGYIACINCKKRAFELIEEVKSGETIHAENAVQKNHIPVSGQPIICDSCGIEVSGINLGKPYTMQYGETFTIEQKIEYEQKIQGYIYALKSANGAVERMVKRYIGTVVLCGIFYIILLLLWIISIYA